MKLLILFFFAGLLGVSANTYSQATKFSLNLEEVTVKEVFRQIERKSEFVFFYNEDYIDVNRKVNVNVKDEKIETILDEILTGTQNTYKIYDRQIVISSAVKKDSPSFSKAEAKAEQKKEISGVVKDSKGSLLPGVTVAVKSTTIGTITDGQGEFKLSIPINAKTLVFTFVGMRGQEIEIVNNTIFNVILTEEKVELGEVVVVGYGIQKKSDITGTVASLPQERLGTVPNTNIAQAIQGAIPGVMVQTTSAGAESTESIMIRGRNSIKASNSPLVIVDGIAGSLNDVNPNDVESIEVLKDASAAAIYGSRGSNGVILVTTKSGSDGKTKVKYNGFYSMQRFAKLPDIMNGEEFYKFKEERSTADFTATELAVYESGKWINWLDLALRNGMTTEHNLSLSGAFKDTHYYISGSMTDVKGLAINDDYLKLTSRINLDTKFRNWLTLGTRTQLAYADAGGLAPTWDGDQGVFWMNPLTKAYDENGNLTIYPWREDTYFRNPLEKTLAKNIDESYQVVSNNYAIVDFPFMKGLQYRVNAGVRLGFSNEATYYGRNTATGLSNGGSASTERGQSRNVVIENILNYNRMFNKHSVFVTGVYSFENTKNSTNSLSAEGFPNDFLTWYGASQAALIVPGFSNSETSLLSAMGRINYSYDSRYLLTLTGRGDGYSGFGAKNKWGFFPSVAVGWNIANESFFSWKDLFNQLKLRGSLGLNGNQAISAYETISRMAGENTVAGATTLPGYAPSKLGQDNLGWESTRTLNVGIDFGILNNRINGDINLYKSNTYDLLLDRTISPIHAVTSITQNIGKTENRGFEISLTSRNIVSKNFQWETTGNISVVKNKIVSLYGLKDENGKEIDDVANAWFIGKPIQVNYGYKWDGVWQLNEAEEAAKYKTQPGYIKIKDVSGPDGIPDGIISANYDRIIIGQKDPKCIWGMNNSFTYRKLTLNVFIHGVHGVTKNNTLLNDAGVDRTVRMTTTKKNWWRPDNPTNDWYMNANDANLQNGISANPYEDASFIRVKDISLSYDFAKDLSRFGFSKFQVYVTGRNLFTFTKFGGMDPELSSQRDIPMQKEYVFGLNLEF